MHIKELDNDLQCVLLWRPKVSLKSPRRNSRVYGVINLEIAKVLKEKGFNDVLPGQKLCRQCVTEYEKLTKPPENENMTEIIETESSQDELASDDDFLLYESP